MSHLIFASPWGWLGLLGLVWVVIVHSLQQVTRKERVSTLFLLERLQLESKEGRRLTWLRQTVPFWLQVLSVLLLTWLLLDPRWQHRDEVQQAVVVLDSTLSMEAFRPDWPTKLQPVLLRLGALAPTTYWTAVCTDPNLAPIYRGTDFQACWKKMNEWHPTLATNDPSRALQLARTLAPPLSPIIFVTDHVQEVPAGVDVLAIGHPVENCAILGMRLKDSEEGSEGLSWQVLVQNDGQELAKRTWWVEASNSDGSQQLVKSPEVNIEIPPKQSIVLKGTFPPGQDRISICLSGDSFALDDRFPIVRPNPKKLAVGLQDDETTTDLFIRLTHTLPALGLATTEGTAPDLTLASINPRRPIPDKAQGTVVFLNDPLAPEGLHGAPYVPSGDALMQDLNWQGLTYQESLPIPPVEGDVPLLWKDKKPLIFIRSLNTGHKQLVFNFNLPHSNVDRLPGFVLLLRRFIESVRDEKVAPESRNFEVGEAFHLAVNHPNEALTLSLPDGSTRSLSPRSQFEAPQTPGFFSISQDGVDLEKGAAELDDAQLSDLSQANSLDTLSKRAVQILEMHADREAWAPLWLLLLGGVLLLNWKWSDPKPQPKQSAAI